MSGRPVNRARPGREGKPRGRKEFIPPATARSGRLDPWTPAKVVSEAVLHLVLLGMVWYGGLGYLGLTLLMSAELVFVCTLSIVIFPERGIGRHLRDIVSLGGVTGFLLIFVLIAYGELIRADGQDASGAVVEAILALDDDVLLWGLAVSAVHLSALALVARLSPRPRLAWVQMAILNAGITVIWLFLLIPVGFLAAGMLGGTTRTSVPAASFDAGLILFAVALRFALALLLSRLPARDLEQIAANPYVD